jgi:hypothetical protein
MEDDSMSAELLGKPFAELLFDGCRVGAAADDDEGEERPFHSRQHDGGAGESQSRPGLSLS